MKKILLILIAVFLTAGCTYNSHPISPDTPIVPIQNNDGTNIEDHDQENITGEDVQKPSVDQTENNIVEAANSELTETDAKALLIKFQERVMLDADEGLKVTDFYNIEAFIDYLSEITSPNLAKEYVDLYYEEKEGALFHRPKFGPIFIDFDKFYQFNETGNQTYELIQENQNPHFGKYKVTVEFQFTGKDWIISNRKFDVEQSIEQALGILTIVNKEYHLPEDYVPVDLVEPDVDFSFDEKLPKRLLQKEAADALEKLFEAAEKENIKLYAVSGYRSYETQSWIFNYNANSVGETEANRYSARPGESEHQTGLAIDVSSSEVGFGLVEDFGDTAAGKWVAKNASEFGFIIRYPENKEDITGYSYEPWHLRYVGVNAAKMITKMNITLEEYITHK